MKAPAPSPHASSATCPECGAAQVDGFSCWGLLGAIIAWELHDVHLASEHFKTVACYNLQHPAQFSEAALAGLAEGLIEQVDGELPSSQIRQRMQVRFAGSQRVLKPQGERQAVLRPWTMTIAEVYQGGQAAGAAERVRQWAASLRAEL